MDEKQAAELRAYYIKFDTEWAHEVVAEHADDHVTMHRKLDDILLGIAKRNGYTELTEIYKAVILGYDIPGETP